MNLALQELFEPPRPLLKGLFSYVLVRSSEGINVASVGPSVRVCGLLGPFLVDITLVFSLFPKFDLTKIRVPGKWPYKTNGFGAHFLTFTHFSNGFFYDFQRDFSFYAFFQCFFNDFQSHPAFILRCALELGTGHWRLETGNWRLGTDDWALETGNRSLETGHWRLETGHRRLGTGDWKPGTVH